MVRIITDSPHRAKEMLDEMGFSASLTPVIAVEVPDRPGGLADVLETLGDAGINVEYAYCFVEPPGDAAVDVFKIDADNAEERLVGRGIPRAGGVGPVLAGRRLGAGVLLGVRQAGHELLERRGVVLGAQAQRSRRSSP